MIPAVTAVRLSGAKNRAELPLLVLGPALGTSATSLWWDCAQHLTDAFDVVAWDLPGHGHNRAVGEEGFTMAELAAGVLVVVDELLAQRDEVGGSFSYVGVSVGGAVGLQLLLDAPHRVRAAVLLGTGSTAGEEAAPAAAPAGVTDQGHAQVLEALAGFDVRDRLGQSASPVLDDVAHLSPDRSPEAVARLVRHHLLGEPADPSETSRRVSADPCQLVTGQREAALDPRARSLVTLAALVVRGRAEEVATHLQAALAQGLTLDELEDAVLETAPYCDGPDADAALTTAREVLAERRRA